MPVLRPGDLAHWCSGEWTRRPPADIQGVVHDSSRVTPGVLFVAIRGARVDGHDFVREAAARGAAAALVRRDRAPVAGQHLPCLAVDDTVLALGAIAAGYRKRQAFRIVGVTGSVGKTTVKEMIAGILSLQYPAARTMGNWNNEIGLPLSLLAMPETTSIGVLELGISHPGEMAPLCAIAAPDWGVITNVGPVHLEFFGSVEAIAREKGVLFSSLSGSGTAVASVDEPCFPQLRAMAPGRFIGVSTGAPADYILTLRDPARGSGTVLERASGEKVELTLPVPGEHNLRNAALAVAAARGFAVPWSLIASALAQYKAPPMRWEQSQAGGVRIINDAYNANPMSMRAALRAFAAIPGADRRWLVLGDMLELGAGAEEEHALIGRELASGSWWGVVTVGRLAGYLAEGALAAGLPACRVRRCATAAEAGEFLSGMVQAGDFVLFKGSRGVHLEVSVETLKGKLGVGG